MTLDKRLDIRDKCLEVNQVDGCLVIKAGKRVVGESFIMCVEGDERILRDAFDEYLATDVFNHYVRCRDINYLRDTTTKDFTQQEILGVECNFIHTDPGEQAKLRVDAGTQVAEITTSVQGTSSEPIFTFGDDNNTIQFTKPETKKVQIDGVWFFVTFVSFHTAVFTIDRIADTLIPEGSQAAVDDYIGELVVDDRSVPESTILFGRIDEQIGEIVMAIETPPDEMIYKTLFDELIGEMVIADRSLDFFGPTDARICDIPLIDPSPSVTPSITPSISISPTITPSITVSPSITPSVTITPTPSITITPSVTITPSITPSITISATPTPSITITPSVTITPSITPTITPTPSVTPPFWFDEYEPCPPPPEPEPDWTPYWFNVYEPCGDMPDPLTRTSDELDQEKIWKDVYEPCDS